MHALQSDDAIDVPKPTKAELHDSINFPFIVHETTIAQNQKTVLQVMQLNPGPTRPAPPVRYAHEKCAVDLHACEISLAKRSRCA